MAVLLIGSTGNGKSTLGNFLLNTTLKCAPSIDGPLEDQENLKHPMQDEKCDLFNSDAITEVFKTAESNMPQTQTVETAAVDINGRRLVVIDTPGLNESAAKDLSHMISVIKRLRETKEVSACILVVKFSTKIDIQYKATVKYYSSLLPNLFSRSVIIVMTDFANDKRTVMLRKRQGIDVEQVKLNTVREIKQCGNLSYPPRLFMIDSIPMDKEELQQSLEVRDRLLQHIASLEPIAITSLRVAKTSDMLIQDEKEIATLKKAIEVYNEGLEKENIDAAYALKQSKNKEAQITNYQNEKLSC